MKHILRTLIVFIIVCCFNFSLYASDEEEKPSLNVGIVVNSHNEIEDLSATLLDQLKTYCTSFFVDDRREYQYVNTMEARREHFTAEKEYMTALKDSNREEIYKKSQELIKASEVLDNISNASLDYDLKIQDIIVVSQTDKNIVYKENDRVPINYSTYNSQYFDERALFEESTVVANYILKENNFDMLVIPASLQISSSMIRLRLKFYNGIDNKFYTLYDSIVPISEIQDKTDEWILSLALHLSSKDYSLYEFEPKDYALAIEIDSEPVKDKGVLLEGEHTVKVSSPGYKTKTLRHKFEKGKINKLNVDLEKETFHKLSIVSEIKNAFVEMEGEVFEIPLNLDTYKTPLNYTVRAEGYIPLVTALTKGSDDKVLNISLRPEWTADKNFVKKEQKDFYYGATAVLGMFTLNIISQSFAYQNVGYNQWSSVYYITSGLMYASLMMLFGELVDYFLASKYNLL